MRERIYVGIDPGKNGGIAFLAEGLEAASKMPGTVGGILRELGSLNLYEAEPVIALELVHSMPHDGRSSLWKFARHYGHLEMALAACKLPFRYVRPLQWQDHFGCRTRGDKRISKAKAQELFPDIRVTHAIADALLLAKYAQETTP